MWNTEIILFSLISKHILYFKIGKTTVTKTSNRHKIIQQQPDRNITGTSSLNIVAASKLLQCVLQINCGAIIKDLLTYHEE